MILRCPICKLPTGLVLRGDGHALTRGDMNNREGAPWKSY